MELSDQRERERKEIDGNHSLWHFSNRKLYVLQNIEYGTLKKWKPFIITSR